jgi:hypothetical protein
MLQTKMTCRHNGLGLFSLILFAAAATAADAGNTAPQNPVRYVSAIPTPAGCKRATLPDKSFAAWLRQRPLRPEGTPVRLYNGSLRPNQNLHAPVLDIPIGKTDLMQCADALMYLRSRYLFESKTPVPICFKDNTGSKHCIPTGATEKQFYRVMQRVYAYCNTATLSREMISIPYHHLWPGDVLLRGGFPGHSMMVVDICTNQQGERFYLLAQGFMPAMDLHIVVNPYQPHLSPWYRLDTTAKGIYTPNYHFTTKEAKRFYQQ